MKKRSLLIALGLFLSWFFVHSLIIVTDGLTDNPRPADCILILGSKVNEDGTLSERLKSRVDKGLNLYRHHYASIIVVSGGLGKEGYAEGTEMKNYLVASGVPATALIVDNAGTNTSKTAVNFLKIASANQFNSVIVVSQYFHITRTKYLLKKEGMSRVYSSHARYAEIRDLYSLTREFFAFYKEIVTS